MAIYKELLLLNKLSFFFRNCFLSYDRKNQEVEFVKQKMISAGCFSEQ